MISYIALKKIGKLFQVWVLSDMWPNLEFNNSESMIKIGLSEYLFVRNQRLHGFVGVIGTNNVSERRIK